MSPPNTGLLLPSQINAQDLAGQTPLHLACERGDLLCVKELLEESQARTDVKDRKGETPVHFAAKLESPVITQVLSPSYWSSWFWKNPVPLFGLELL